MKETMTAAEFIKRLMLNILLLLAIILLCIGCSEQYSILARLICGLLGGVCVAVYNMTLVDFCQERRRT